MKPVGEIIVPVAAPYGTARRACKQSHNMSGLICIGDGHCLMVADERVGLHRLKIDRSGRDPVVSHDAALRIALPPSVDEDEAELDLEAVARHGASLFLVGSHANGRNSGAVNPHSHYVGIIDQRDVLGNGVIAARWTSLDDLFRKWLRLGSVLNTQLQCGGINIEGATVFKDRLLIGLRSPVRHGLGVAPAAYVVSTPVEGVLGGDFSGADLHKLPTQHAFIGIRDMETVGSRVLLVTGDAGVNDLEGNATPQCGANINGADEDRPFQLRLWKPLKGDRMEDRPLHEFRVLDEVDCDGRKSRAKVEGIAKDPAADHAYFVVYDGSAKVFYLKNDDLP